MAIKYNDSFHLIDFICFSCFWYSNIFSVQCKISFVTAMCDDSVQLVRDRNGLLRTVAIEYNEWIHLIDSLHLF